MVDPDGTGVLASGGIESAVLLHHLADEGHPVQPLYIRQGFRWEHAELLALERFLAAAPRPVFRPLAVLVAPLADLYPPHHFARSGTVPRAGSPDEDTCLPGRNVTILGKAGVFAALTGLSGLAIGSLAANDFPDASASFFGAMAGALSEGLGRRIRIQAPFAGLEKSDVLLLGRSLPIHLTISCLDPVAGVHCGQCSKCAERREGYRRSGLADPTEYARDHPALGAAGRSR